ncbi:hypothetical protein M9H77_00878 [Catharanthus roseus]|uniref:Uncharacterized protein n=1 Tax=Catharanthus roseus TaxID=4058 RepID=A0ACC0C3Z6_CATRO|nr:hypothetical protein M9H77_00878 [Catharanthus roseus]
MVDPANSTLGKMLLDEITPVVMVIRTSLVEEISQRNGLSFNELLSPFCVFNNIDVPVRTASDQPYRLRKFKLRLFNASDIRQPNIEVANERIRQVITRAGEKDFPDVSAETVPIETVLSTSTTKLLSSWFLFFNKELVRTVSFSEHEAFDHPVACLLAVSSKDDDPINKFVDLFNSDQLPPLFNDGAMDPNILKHFVLVHDNQDGTAERATKILAEMKATFGASNCRLLCINSSEDGSVQHLENPWASFKNDGSSDQQLGRFLSMDDMDELKNAMHDLSSKHIIPYMEQKVRVLNQQVSATRRGFRNQIKNLWWRKGKEDVPDNPNGPTYTFSSMESQIRVLGDYAFMLRDYELALSNYKLLSTDYKLDKAWKHLAGAQEMIGLTHFMLDLSSKDAEYWMEHAFATYSKLGSSGHRNATRCGLWWVEMLKATDQFKEAANVYFRISGEELLHSAVMLEQASYCYLFSSPPLLRKYGFHLVLSGDLYKKCDQIKHAIRTYRSALSVFRGTTWNHIKDHVHFHIGKWYAFLGMFDVAITHMLEILACGHQSKATQELFLRDFFQIVQKTGKTFEVLKLQLPVINISSLRVFFEDHRTYGSDTAVSVKESFWQSLEEDMIPSYSSMKTNWLDSHGKNLTQKYKDSSVCVAGEVIKVDVEFTNPLQIPISVSGVSLICEHSGRSDGTNSDSNSSTSKIELVKLGVDGNLNGDTSSFVLSEVDLLLSGGETILAQLTVVPKVEGTLEIVGVRWKLSGSVSGFCKFDPDLFKKKAAGGKRKSKKSLSNRMKFLVIKSVPKLEATMHHLPESLYAGNLRRLALELRNSSNTPVKNLKMKVSHPRFLSIGDQEVMKTEFPGCLERRGNFAQGHASAKTNKASDNVFLFPEDTVISGESPFLWPVYLRAAVPGNISLYTIIYYEVGDTSSVIRYRLLRMHYNVEVLPSLDVSFQISPRPSRLQEFLVRMDIINKTSSEKFQFHQLSSVGNEWEISLVQPMDTIFPSDFLVAGEALSCYFKLKSCRKRASPEGDVSCKVPLEKSNIRLGHDKSEELYDISRSPLVDFHHCERANQGISKQEHLTEVDFILISRSQSDGKAGLELLSHHACHCSVASSSPIWWLMESPKTIRHDFGLSFCEIKLKMTIHNASDSIASIHFKTFDSTANTNSSTAGASSVSAANEAGWHDTSLQNDIKLTSDAPGNRVAKPLSPVCVSPFIWSASSSTRVKLEPLSSIQIPLQICVFSPGTHDISNYTLHWDLDGPTESSGTCQGQSYYISVLQQD